MTDALDGLAGPVLLVHGGRSDVVTDESVAAFRRQHPDTRLVTIDGAGHAVQGDRPVELSHALLSFWPSSSATTAFTVNRREERHAGSSDSIESN